MRRVQEPFTLPDHPELLKEVIEMSIAIKLHYIVKGETLVENHNIGKAQAHHEKPTWENVVQLLDKCYQIINQKRHNPIKY